MTTAYAHVSTADTIALSTCPDCHRGRGRQCVGSTGRDLSTPHAARRRLAHGVQISALHRDYPGLWRSPRLTAWHAGRAWDRDEAEALRLWLRCYGPVLWQPPRTTSGTL